MPEQNPFNNPSYPQDQSLSGNISKSERWAPPKQPAHLESSLLDSSNPTFIIDTSVNTNIDTTIIGLTSASPNGVSFEVSGFVGFGGRVAETGESEHRIPIIKETTKGRDKFTIMGIGSDGSSKAVHTFSMNESVHIGRNPEDFVDSKRVETSINLEQLGIKSGDTQSISRDHLTLTWTNEGIVVRDHSTFGTKVEAIKKKTTDMANQVMGGAVTSLSGGVVENVPVAGFIDKVPKTAEEASQALEARQSEIKKPLFEQVRKLEEKVDEIKGKYNADQQILMTRYANEWNAKRESQRNNDGDGSYRHERYAAEALFALPQSARSDAEHVMTLMQQIDTLNNRIFS